MVANPSWAGGTGGCPTGLSAYMPASSAWKSASNSSWWCWRSHTNSLARLIRLITSRSSREHSTGGCHTPGRTTPPPTVQDGTPPPRRRRQPTRSGYLSGSLAARRALTVGSAGLEIEPAAALDAQPTLLDELAQERAQTVC